ncbi:MAG: O-antigen ligase family protein [Janthinobacterium lividum]
MDQESAFVRWIVILSFIASAFSSASPGAGALAFVCPGVFIALGIKRFVLPAKSNIPGGSVDALALSIALFIPIVGQIGSLFQSDLYGVSYAWLFLLLSASIISLRLRISLEWILSQYVLAGVVTIFLFAVASHTQLLAALARSSDSRGVAYRYAPLGMHPNLVGHVFGAYCVALFWAAMDAKKRVKQIVLGLTSAIALVMCAAASSRGGLFAAVAGILGSTFIYYSRSSKQLLRYAAICVFFIAAALLLSGSARTAVSDLLQLDSKFRGLNSGLTGRTANWGILVTKISESASVFFVGGGFRSAGLEQLGFDVDNSYLTIILELGIPAFILIMLRCIVIGLRMTSLIRREGGKVNAAMMGILIYFLLESVVARYMVAIGNPASMIFLCILLLALGAPRAGRISNISKLPDQNLSSS